MDSFKSRLMHGWNAFKGQEQERQREQQPNYNLGVLSTENPGRVRLSMSSERSIISTVTNRIALDVASFDFHHVKLDQNGRYQDTINDSFHQCLTIEANKDQTGRAFIQDVVMSMFDEGTVAIIPVETSINPNISNAYDINSFRTGKILDWYPNHIRVEVYNDLIGIKEYLTLPKNMVGIIENPLYAIMNEPNSTLKRLIRALNLLDITDEKINSGKLDLIIQLPYTVKSEKRQLEAQGRVKAISQQLEGNKYGVAYADSTERIIQLNRPVENNLLAKVQYLTNMFYNQLGMSESIFTGKATPAEIQNYYDRSVEPIVTAIVDEMKRKFLTKTARTQGHSVMAFRDIFRLIPANELANLADVFSRNAIFTANDWRQILGRKPSDDPKANELSNKNMPEQPGTKSVGTQPKNEHEEPPKERSKEEIQGLIDKLQKELRKPVL
jgi:hypothetical protein